MANAWQMHVKKTMEDMKKSSGNATVYLKDVLKKAKVTYKKPSGKVAVEQKSEVVVKKTRKTRKARKSRKSRKSKKSRKSRKSRKSKK